MMLPASGRGCTLRCDLHILEVARLVVDADARWRDPARELAGLSDALHQALDELAVSRRRQPLLLVARPGGRIDDRALRRHLEVLELANVAMERHVRQLQLVGNPGALDDLVPA